ncbi:MAG TPA: hypothetical protein VGI60_07640 [Chthoniobacterales bacterium]|jgi:hypothetical protein
MKHTLLAIFLVLGLATLVSADNPTFPGFEKAMDPATYQKAGLGKLTNAERAALNSFVRDYVATKQKDAAAVAAAQAVDRAVKERKVQPPDIIESRIVGTYRGTNLRTLFRLENGQVWKPSNSEIASSPPVENPNVVIYRDIFGYKMFIEGARIVRVKRVE